MLHVCALLLLLTWLGAGQAAAQPADYHDLVRQAVAAQERGDFAGAYALLSEAHVLFPNARTLRGMGIASFQAGHPLRAVRELEQALVHPTRALTDELRASAEEIILRARAELGAVALVVSPASATLSLDGGVGAPVPAELHLEPGPHELLFTAEGFVTQRLGIEVVRGASQALRVNLAAVPAPVVTRPADAPGPSSASFAPAPREGMGAHSAPGLDLRQTFGFTALGLGAASALASGISFKLAKDDLDAVTRECRVPGACDPRVDGAETRDSRLDSRHFGAKYRAYQVTLGVAIVAGVTGAGLLAWQWSAGRARAKVALSSCGATLRFDL